MYRILKTTYNNDGVLHTASMQGAVGKLYFVCTARSYKGLPIKACPRPQERGSALEDPGKRGVSFTLRFDLEIKEG